MSARGAREREAADRTYLRSLPASEAARVMGSRDKLQKVLRGADPLTIVNDGRLDGYRITALGDNLGMSGKHDAAGRELVAGLIDAARQAPAGDAKRLAALWMNPERLSEHVAKRVREGVIAGVDDYARRTFSVLAAVERLTIAEPQDPKRRFTGKAQVAADGWIVLLSADGRLVTSYPFMPNKVTFEQRHRDAGDRVYEYPIPLADRQVLAKLLGPG